MTAKTAPADRPPALLMQAWRRMGGAERWSAVIVRASAASLVLLGGLVMVGWWLRIPAIVQISADFTPMQFNTALGFVLCGAGLGALALRRPALVLASAAAIAAIAGLTLVQYATGLSLGLDEVFVEHFTTVETSHPGRMAPNTAFAFLVSAAFLACAVASARLPIAMSALLVLSPGVVGLATLSLVGYAAGVEALFGWSEYTRMAVHTSAGFLLFGIGAVVKAWRLEAQQGRSRSWSLIAPSIVSSLTLLAGIWLALSHYEAERVALLSPIAPHVVRTALPEIVLGIGLVITLLIGVAVHYVHEARQTETLRNANEELRQAVRELDKFAHVASHDLKAPLRGIRQLARWLRKDLEEDADPRTQRYLSQLDTRVERLQDLLDALLSYARISSPSQAPDRFEVRSAVEAVVELADLPSSMHVEISAGDIVLKAVRGQFDAVVLNLVSNAAKHHDRESGRIGIEIFESADAVVLRVTDDGPGIDRAHQERIFDIFQTLRPRDELEASGIGLAIVRKVLTQVGGSIRIESDPAERRGSTFVVTWPKEVSSEYRHHHV
jgi:signal transduction histidine kinase